MKIIKKQKLALLAAISAASAVPATVMAALPAGVTTAITDAQADVTEAGGLILIVAAVIAGVFWIRRVLR